MLDKSRFFKQLVVLRVFYWFGIVLIVAHTFSCIPTKKRSIYSLPVNNEVVDLLSMKIGAAEWTVQNLDVVIFSNGDSIQHAQSDVEWSNAGRKRQPAWCYYNNDSTTNKLYGKLYNWYAVSDPRGLAPKGWKIASENDWSKLSVVMGGIDLAGAKMLNKNNKDFGAFVPKASGFRLVDGNFYSLGYEALWWTSTPFNDNFAWSFALNFPRENLTRGYSYKDYGLSVRCVKIYK